MDCSTARNWIFRHIDGELGPSETVLLESHAATCAACARDMKLVSIPRRIGQALPALEPSPYFYTRLRARIGSLDQGVTMWQFIMTLSRHMIPALAAVTLALVSVFAYFQFHEPNADLYQAYDNIFMSGDRPQRMVIADQGDITDESVLRSIAEVENAHRTPAGSETAPK